MFPVNHSPGRLNHEERCMDHANEPTVGWLDRREFLRGAGALAAGAVAGAAGMSAVSAAPGAEGIVELDALALSALIRARRLSCVEVMQAYLAQIARHNPRVNAIVSLRPEDELLAEARACDAELARGASRGWMHGFPHAVKDLSDVRGLRTTHGSPVLKDNLAAKDSIFVERIRAAGAIFIGKTNVPEFGLGSQSYNPVFGVTRNAWDATRTAGGSSGGAAVALALGMVPVADGSDMMGSLRNPAAWNNVIGFRPSYGRVPNDTVRYLEQLGYSGPMGRTVPETARLLATMAGFDPRDPLSIAEDPAVFAGSLELDPKGLRIGWMGDYEGHLPMEPGVLALCRDALGTFTAMGCIVEDAKPAFDPERLWRAWLVLRQWTYAAKLMPLYENPRARAQLKPELVWEIEGGLPITGLQLAAAAAARAEWYQALRELFTRFDALVLPSAQVFPFAAETHWPKEIAGRSMDTYHRWMEVVIGGTLSGCPIANVPAGFDPRGLPMGLQLIGPTHADLALLRLAAAYEQASGFTRRRPPTFASA
jgi:amidase